MFDQSHRLGPFWFWGILLALVLIFVSIRSRDTLDNQALEQRFISQPTAVGAMPALPLPQLDLGQFPPEMQQAARDMQQRLGLGQSVPVLTPVTQSARLRVEVREVRRVTDGVQVLGQVTNISGAEAQVPMSAFELRDSAGVTYVASGAASARLTAGESTPLDMTVPLPQGRGLLLALRFPPDPPVEQVLLVGGSD